MKIKLQLSATIQQQVDIMEALDGLMSISDIEFDNNETYKDVWVTFPDGEYNERLFSVITDVVRGILGLNV